MVESIGPSMTFWILPISGIPIPRPTVIQIYPSELQDVNVEDLFNDFTLIITSKLENITNHVGIIESSIPSPRKVDSINSTRDLWEGDINMLPYKHTSEECTMEQLDKFIGSLIPIEIKDGLVLMKLSRANEIPLEY